jgi:lysophospholipase L1-like esterase
MTTDVGGDLAVISLGANDWHLDTYENLRRLRRSITARRVFWLMPNIKRLGVRDAIQRIANETGDQLIDTAPLAGADHVHPTMAGYRKIAHMIVTEVDP